MNRIKAKLDRPKGLKWKPYCFTSDKLTIGTGPNLDDQGISPKQAYAILKLN